jgi:hypothetical protein
MHTSGITAARPAEVGARLVVVGVLRVEAGAHPAEAGVPRAVIIMVAAAVAGVPPAAPPADGDTTGTPITEAAAEAVAVVGAAAVAPVAGMFIGVAAADPAVVRRVAA